MTKLEIAMAYAKNDFSMFRSPHHRYYDKNLGPFEVVTDVSENNIKGFIFYCDNSTEINNVLRLMSHYKIPYKHTQAKLEYIYTDGILSSDDINFISCVLHNIRGRDNV